MFLKLLVIFLFVKSRSGLLEGANLLISKESEEIGDRRGNDEL